MSGSFRELWFLLRDRSAQLWIAIAFLAASVSVIFGLDEISEQRATIERLKTADQIERSIALEDHRDWGSAAYYTFHLTCDPPSNFAFAALGQRDPSPWKHRIRMLALEGQIYETDAANPDFAFVIAILSPLLLILLLYDLRAAGRLGGRYELLCATSANGPNVWMSRALWRVIGLALALLGPLWIGAGISGTNIGTIALASFAVIGHLIFWWALIAAVNRWGWTAPVNLTALIAAWLALAILIPAVLKAGINTAVLVPDGGDIILTQREAVKDAWDLPISATMDPFLECHPDWAEHTQMDSTFEWKWYYAFQQVGDQTVEPLSMAYSKGRASRERLASKLAWLSPPAKLERIFQSIAITDVPSQARYEARVRAFHAELRDYYYPGLFLDTPFSDKAVDPRPDFAAQSNSPDL